ncbi:DUF4365 domain-containing protein [Streptomyces sp. NPDC090054]|uniref:DUF4365 domain-containing protein n=1 Tax=Streptomyces sp. NPDC090054 TaxID=3365933 RepID=UPI0037F52CA7
MGNVGELRVQAEFAGIGWDPIPVSQESDLGIDLFAQVCDERRFDRGLLVGVQVKAGESFFAKPKRGPGGAVIGWWYTDDDSKHVDGWANHSIPVLLVLHDESEQRSYWVHVTSERIEVTGKGAKVLVPAHQILGAASLPELLAVAVSQRRPVSWEGSSLGEARHAISPRERLRHALLLPRLVAPHQNAGHGKEIEPEAGLALLLQARIRDYEVFADRYVQVPSLTEAAASSSWRWRLVSAFWRLVSEEDIAGLTELLESAPREDQRAATCVILASGLVEQGLINEANAVLSKEIQRDAASPLDHAWMLAHRAQVSLELGDMNAAREDAALAQAALSSDLGNLTASVIASASAQVLFRTAPWGVTAVVDYVRASDTVANWWRSQTMADAYREEVGRAFHTWSQKRSIVFSMDRAPYNQLRSALWMARLSALSDTWRGTASLLARQILVSISPDSNTEEVEEAIDLLRRAGNSSVLKDAVRRLRRGGPLQPLAKAVKKVPPMLPWPATAARGNLILWEVAGQLLEVEAADSAARSCLDLLQGVKRLAPFPGAAPERSDQIMYSLAGVLPGASIQVHREVRDYLTRFEPQDLPREEEGIRILLEGLDETVFDTLEKVVAWREAAENAALVGQISTRMLGLISTKDQRARELLLARIADGDPVALYVIGGSESLDPEVLRGLVTRYGRIVGELVADARRGAISLRGDDPARTLCFLNFACPEVADWEPILLLFRSSGAAHHYMRGSCLIMARKVVELPEFVSEQLRSILPEMGVIAEADSVIASMGESLGGAPLWLAAALGGLDEENVAEHIVRLVNGSWQERRDAVIFVGWLSRPGDTPLLVGMMQDENDQVRMEAVAELAKRANSSVRDFTAEAALTCAVQHDSVAIPLAVMQGSAAGDRLSATGRRAARELRGHPSARVRKLAQEVLKE